MTLDHEVEVLKHQFARNAVETLNGIARFVSPTTVDVEVDDGEVEQFSAEKFIIAVGTKPYRPEEIPFDGTRIFDSDEILKIKRLPRSLTVIGGGVIGVE